MAAGAPGYDQRRHQRSLTPDIVGVPKPLAPYTPEEPKSFEPYKPGEPESFQPDNPDEPESFQPYNPDEGEVDPLPPYLAESKGDPPETQLITVVVAILSLICIVICLLVILEMLWRSPAGDITVREPGETNVIAGGRGVGQTLIVPQPTLRVAPMTAPRREATTGQGTLINAAETTTEMRTEEITSTTPRTETTNAQTALRTAAQTTAEMTTEEVTTPRPEVTTAQTELTSAAETTTEMTTKEITSATPRTEVTTAQTELTSAAETTTEMTTKEITSATPRTEVTTAQTELTSAAETTTEMTTKEITSATPRTEVTTAQTELTSAAETTTEMTTEEITRRNVKAQTTTETATEGISPTIVKALHRAPLVCTMGNKTNSTRMFPADGLCEYIFYDSLYKKGPAEFEPYDLDADIRIFFDARRNFTTTGFGIGFSFRYAYYLKDVFEVATAGTPYMIWYFWRHNITHFGILDTPTRDFNESSVTVALESLKMLDNVSDPHRAKGHMCIIVFAAVIPDDTWENYYIHKFSTIFTPQLFIGLSHYECGDNTFQDCRVVPPTLLSRPPEIAAANSSYQHDMTMAADHVDKMATRGVSAVWAISVTMKGRWTVLDAGDSPGFLSRCVYDPAAESFGSYAEVCNDPKFGQEYNYSLQLHAAQFYSATDRRLLSFDDEVALGQKLCTIKAQHTSIDIGIAAFDLDYEDFSNACASTNWGGRFSRLRALKLLLNFFRTQFNDSSAKDVCLGLVT